MASRLLAIVLFPLAVVVAVPVLCCFAALFYLYGVLEAVRQMFRRRREPLPPSSIEPRRQPHFLDVSTGTVRKP